MNTVKLLNERLLPMRFLATLILTIPIGGLLAFGGSYLGFPAVANIGLFIAGIFIAAQVTDGIGK
jgi:hypothetical protein